MSTPRSMFQIGPFDVIAKLGGDALGSTYLCRDDRTGAHSRVTHVDERLTSDSQFREALEAAQPTLAFEDPHLVPAEVGLFGWGSYLATPDRECATLADLLATNHACAPRLLARILLDVLAGLSAAHDHGHLHLHLSPDRIEIGGDGVARVSELGLARLRGLVEPGVTPYTAPRHADEAVDARADIFAIGAIAWSALTGQALFAGHDERATRERLLGLPVPPPSEVGARPPAAWDAVVLRALARVPDDRYPNARELAAMLPEAATPAEVGLWVESTYAEVFARRRLLALEPAREMEEVPACLIRDAPPRARSRRPSRGMARAVGLLSAAFACGMGVAWLLP